MHQAHHVQSGRVEGGRLKLNRGRFKKAIADMPDCAVTLTIEKKHANRSMVQNAYWWGVCVELVSDHTGYSPDEVHELAKRMFLPKHLVFTKGNGEIVGEFVVGGSTTKLNKIEFGEFVERYRQWAAETLGVVIPDPDPDLREKVNERGLQPVSAS